MSGLPEKFLVLKMSLCDIVLYIIKKINENGQIANLKRIKSVLYLLQKKGFITTIDSAIEALDKLIIQGKVKVKIVTTYDPKTGLKNMRTPIYYTDEEVNPEAEKILKWIISETHKKTIDV